MSIGREPSATKAPAMGHSNPLTAATPAKAPMRGALVTGAASQAILAERLRAVQKIAERVKEDASLRSEIHAIESMILR